MFDHSTTIFLYSSYLSLYNSVLEVRQITEGIALKSPFVVIVLHGTPKNQGFQSLQKS